jgi:hypothetical protein
MEKYVCSCPSMNCESKKFHNYFHGRKARCILCKRLCISRADRDVHMDFIHSDTLDGGKTICYTYRNKVIKCDL